MVSELLINLLQLRTQICVINLVNQPPHETTSQLAFGKYLYRMRYLVAYGLRNSKIASVTDTKCDTNQTVRYENK